MMKKLILPLLILFSISSFCQKFHSPYYYAGIMDTVILKKAGDTLWHIKLNKTKDTLFINNGYLTGGKFTQVQSDWNVSDTLLKSFIKNKPTIPDATFVHSTLGVNRTKMLYSGDILQINPLGIQFGNLYPSVSGFRIQQASDNKGLALSGKTEVNTLQIDSIATSSSAPDSVLKRNPITGEVVQYKIPYIPDTTSLAKKLWVYEYFAPLSTLANFVPTSRTLTINGTTKDWTTSQSWTIATTDTSLLIPKSDTEKRVMTPTNSRKNYYHFANHNDIADGFLRWHFAGSSITDSNYVYLDGTTYVTGTPWRSEGYLTSYTETDPTIYSWAKATNKPSYNWSEIGSRPTALSQFTNDLGNYGSFLTSETDPLSVHKVGSQYASTTYTATVSVDWNNGNVQTIQLASGTQSITFANPLSSGRYILKLKQPTSGAAGTISSWPASVYWPSDVVPTLTSTNSKVDVIGIFYDGSYYDASCILNYTH